MKLGVADAVQAILQERAVRPDVRGLVVQVLADADTVGPLVAALHGALDVEIVVADGRPESDDRLATLNRGRDLLLRSGRSVVLIQTSGASGRRLRELANDLTSAPDLFVEVLPAAPLADWDRVRAVLRAAMRGRHGAIDLTGLVPTAGDVVRVDLASTYMRSVWPSGDRKAPDGPLIVLAQPGAGKTTWMRFLALAASQDERALPDVLPSRVRAAVYVPLSAYAAAARDRVVPLPEFVALRIADIAGSPGREALDHGGELAVLLDGLDEVGSRDLRRRLLREAREWSAGPHGPVVIVTGRSHLRDEIGAPDGVDVLELDAPSDDDVEHYVHALLTARHGTDADSTGLAADVMRRLHQDRDLRPFRHVPLLLTFLVVLADLGHELPDQRTLLYRDLVEMLIGSWRRIRVPAGPQRALRRGDVLRVLAPLGWWIVTRGGGGVPEEALLAALTEIEGGREPDAASARRQAETRLAQLRDDTALLRVEGLWQFTHPTLAEYFAAQAALQDPEFLARLVADPYARGWEQVVVFTVALAADVEVRDDVAGPLLDALLARSRRRGRYDGRFTVLLMQVLWEVRSLPETTARALFERALELGLTYKLSGFATFTAVNALFRRLDDLVNLHPVLGDVVQRWFGAAGGVAVRWDQVGRHLAWQTLTLPGRLARMGVDPRGVLRAWHGDTNAWVRPLGWLGWAAGSRLDILQQDRLAAALERRTEPPFRYPYVGGPLPFPVEAWEEIAAEDFQDPELAALLAEVRAARRVGSAPPTP